MDTQPSHHPGASPQSSEAFDWQTQLSLPELQALLDGETGAPETRPQPGDWGYYLNLGPELGYFSWFPDAGRMLGYLVRVEILHAPTSLPERADYDALVDRLRQVALAYAADGDGEAACTAFNACFPDFKLAWLGNFTQLKAGATPFSRALLKAFAALGAGPPDTEAFADFVENYGL